MARRKFTDPRRPYILIAERDGVELGRWRLLALDEHDALSDAANYGSQIGIGLFELVDYRVEATNAAGSPTETTMPVRV